MPDNNIEVVSARLLVLDEVGGHNIISVGCSVSCPYCQHSERRSIHKVIHLRAKRVTKSHTS